MMTMRMLRSVSQTNPAPHLNLTPATVANY